MKTDIPVADVHYDNRFNCRGPVSIESAASLAELIAKEGLINPITVRDGINKPWHLICGHRRFIAVRDILKWETIPAICVPNCSDTQAAKLNLIENLGREQLHLGQEVRALEKIFPEGTNPKLVAETLGVSERWAKARLSVRKLSAEPRRAALAGKLSASDILILLTVPAEGQSSALHDLLAAKKSKEAVKAKALMKGKRKRPTQTEIFQMMTTLLERGIEPTWGRAMAWAAGTISDEEFLDNT